MTEPLSTAQFSALVGTIYDAALDAGRWPAALEEMRLALDCCNAILGLQTLPTGRLILNISLHVPDEYLRKMAELSPYVIELWGGEQAVANMSFLEPHVVSRVPGVTDFATTTNRYALEWAKPQGIIDALSVGLARDSRAFGSVNFGRHESAGPFGNREVEIARLLVPHLQRSATITRLYENAASAGESFGQVLDGLRIPVILVTADLAIVHANPAAAAFLDGESLLSVSRGVLGAQSPPLRAALAAAVLDAANDEAALGRQGLGIPVKDEEEGGHKALYVMPMRRRHLNLGRDAVAAIFIAAADAPAAAPTNLVARLFDLTSAEARVYEQLCAGRTLAQAADLLGTKPTTVKTHLQRLFEKTGTRRQNELLLLAMSLAPILG